jgi:hypothetical protein
MNNSYILIHSRIFFNKNYSYLQKLRVKYNNIIDINDKIIHTIKNIPENNKKYNDLYNIKLKNIYNNFNNQNLPVPFPDDKKNIKYNIIIYLEIIKSTFNYLINENIPIPSSKILLKIIFDNKTKYLNNMSFHLLDFYKKNYLKDKTNYIKFNTINIDNKYKTLKNTVINSLIKPITLNEYKKYEIAKYNLKIQNEKFNSLILLKQLKNRIKSDYKKAQLLELYRKKIFENAMIAKKIEYIESLSISNNETCSICLEDNIRNIGITRCGHIFCFKCLTSSIILSKKCPKCRNFLDIFEIYKINNYKKETSINDYSLNYLRNNLGSKVFSLLQKVNKYKGKMLILTNKENITLLSYIFSYFNIQSSLYNDNYTLKNNKIFLYINNSDKGIKNISFFSDIIVFDIEIKNILKNFTLNVSKINKNITFTQF